MADPALAMGTFVYILEKTGYSGEYAVLIENDSSERDG